MHDEWRGVAWLQLRIVITSFCETWANIQATFSSFTGVVSNLTSELLDSYINPYALGFSFAGLFKVQMPTLLPLGYEVHCVQIRHYVKTWNDCVPYDRTDLSIVHAHNTQHETNISEHRLREIKGDIISI